MQIKVTCSTVLIFLFASLAIASPVDDQLFKALYRRDEAAAKMLIENGANINVIGNYGWTPLMVAASKGLYETSRLLIEQGADINARNTGGVTPLMWAVNMEEEWPDSVKLVRLLIASGADVNAKTKAGKTALSWAKKYNQKEMIQILQDAGAKE